MFQVEWCWTPKKQLNSASGTNGAGHTRLLTVTGLQRRAPGKALRTRGGRSISELSIKSALSPSLLPAVLALISVKKLNSLKHLVRTTVAGSHN